MSTTSTLTPGTYSLDPARSKVSVTVKKLGFITVVGTLDIVSSSVVVNDEGTVTSVEAAVDAASYTTGNDKRDVHVRSADFLDAEQHPQITFRSEIFIVGTDGDTTAKGSVNVKGVDTPLAIEVSGVDADASGGSFTATATVERGAIGVDKMPNFVIGSTLAIDITAVAAPAA